MKDLQHNNSSFDSSTPWVKRALILGQFFLIIFVYHILKDLKDTLVITSSDAGAEIIPFIKIWVILPFAVLASYLFSKFYQKFGREKTFNFFVTMLLSAYAFFAFFLYPLRHELYLNDLAELLKISLPLGCKGFIAMICYWIYTFFYLAAELWAMMILTVLFWGYLNERTSVSQAKVFYPLCVFTGNCAGILSGQSSSYLCRTFTNYLSWQETMQLMVAIVMICGIGIIVINRVLSGLYDSSASSLNVKQFSHSLSFKDSLLCVFRSRPLLCIALLVIGFGLTSNLIEVVWKDSIKNVYPLPQAYNAYVNQLTSLIGILAVVMSLVSRRIFQRCNWSQVALITPVVLFITSSIFFVSLQLPKEHLAFFSSFLNMNPLYLVMTLGSIYYVLAMTAKYTIFDMCKEMAFLSIGADERMRAKAVIDSVGSRLGKSGSSCLYQVLLVTFGSTTGHIPIVGLTAVCVIGISIVATRNLGYHLSKQGQKQSELTEAIS
jgi:ATP:ADP antiporter, AAA family